MKFENFRDLSRFFAAKSPAFIPSRSFPLPENEHSFTSFRRICFSFPDFLHRAKGNPSGGKS
ncbi:MAG: hypothetical protein QM680_02365 [Luteolibacter sp.]